MRVLVTGSRDWDDFHAVFDALRDVRWSVPWEEKMTVVHGACPTGADKDAADWAAVFAPFNVTEERHPAQWRIGNTFVKAAGMYRNQAMVDLGADVCLAFIKGGSRGATHCAAAAEAAGIPTRRYTA